ncbi:hypothetical protein [Mesobacillus subterraneus]|uniref:Uncharacterized protein n=1 Tax=Mesobacillus subterraneus TaxID=285983 RepID=A0A427TWI2_9BACI|nr:hypothetical protein [Mesobacillus subterraneus]RSD28838.1 hypothetical protein EJA10_04515 [Mesobacillus subterraneus]
MSGNIFWLLVAASGVLFVFGLLSKSWKHLVLSGAAVLLPSLYFLGAENWFRILALMPLLPFGLACLFGRREKRNLKTG